MTNFNLLLTVAQATILTAGAFAMVSSPVIISVFVKKNPHGWRNFYVSLSISSIESGQRL